VFRRGANRQLCTSMVSCTSHSELNIPGVERLVLCGYANLEELQQTHTYPVVLNDFLTQNHVRVFQGSSVALSITHPSTF
jgi:hypothetical protein